MTAAEARKKALSSKNGKIQSQLSKARIAISNAADKGEFTVTLYDELLLSEVKKTLESDGFRVRSFSDQREGPFTEISW